MDTFISWLRAGGGADLPAEHGLQRIGVRPPLRRYLRALWARLQFTLTMATSHARARNFNTTSVNAGTS